MTLAMVAMDNGLLVARERAGSWQSEIAAVPSPRCLAIVPGSGTLLCGSETAGLWRSSGGREWARVAGIPEDNLTAVSVHPVSGSWYVGSEPSRLFRSQDGGARWQELDGFQQLPSASRWAFPPRPWTHHVRWIEPDPHDARGLWLCIEAGALLRSEDGGATWQDRVPGGPIDTHTLRADPTRPGTLYAAAGDGFFESHDGGATWQRPMEGLQHGYLVGLALAGGTPPILLASAARSPHHAYNPDDAHALLYRRVAGEQWQPVAGGFPAPHGTTIPLPATDPRTPDRLYAATNHGLFRSDDRGTSWDMLPVPWPDSFRRQRAHAVVVGENRE